MLLEASFSEENVLRSAPRRRRVCAQARCIEFLCQRKHEHLASIEHTSSHFPETSTIYCTCTCSTTEKDEVAAFVGVVAGLVGTVLQQYQKQSCVRGAQQEWQKQSFCAGSDSKELQSQIPASASASSPFHEKARHVRTVMTEWWLERWGLLCLVICMYWSRSYSIPFPSFHPSFHPPTGQAPKMHCPFTFRSPENKIITIFVVSSRRQQRQQQQ
jgi:hypothetical protein